MERLSHLRLQKGRDLSASPLHPFHLDKLQPCFVNFCAPCDRHLLVVGSRQRPTFRFYFLPEFKKNKKQLEQRWGWGPEVSAAEERKTKSPRPRFINCAGGTVLLTETCGDAPQVVFREAQ